MELSGGKKFCVYMNISRFFIQSKEAQQFTTSRECTDFRIGAAFVVKNAGVKIFANLFMRFFKSKTPMRLFNGEEDALIWMRTMNEEATKKK